MRQCLTFLSILDLFFFKMVKLAFMKLSQLGIIMTNTSCVFKDFVLNHCLLLFDYMIIAKNEFLAVWLWGKKPLKHLF